MSNKLQLRVFIASLLFFVASMSAMLVYAQNKAVVIDEVEGQIGIEEEVPTDNRIVIRNLNLQKDGDEGAFIIPLPQGVTAEQVSIENKYILQELWVSIEKCEASFFEQQMVTGDTSNILSGTYEVREDRVVLRLLLADIFECKNLLENGRLVVEPVNPHDVYDKIIVVDPLSGEQQWGVGSKSICENEVALDVAKRLQVKLADSGVKAYFTRLENVERSLQLRQHLVDTLRPDFMVSIGTNAEEGEAFGTNYGVEGWYNTYFTPQISSVNLVDALVRQVATETLGRGNGIWEVQNDEMLFCRVSVPAVQLGVGYLTNEKERELLAQEDYRDKIAEGICKAIIQMFEGDGLHGE